MKKLIKNLKQSPAGLLMPLIVLSMVLSGCGGSGTPQGEKDQATDEGVVEKVIDTKAHSDSRGVGRFTDVKVGASDAAIAAKGEPIFTTKCATCHLLTDMKKVGPGLKGVTERRTPEWIMNMITNPSGMLASDPVAKQLLKEIMTPMTFQNVTDDEARQIMEFLRKNDGK
jgi:hypothetical protein